MIILYIELILVLIVIIRKQFISTVLVIAIDVIN